MNQRNQEENGDDSRQHLVLKLESGRRREMTATVRTTALNDEQQVRFDAEVQTLLADLVRGALERI